MKIAIVAALAVVLSACTITLHEDPKLLQSQASLIEHVDRLTLSIDRVSVGSSQAKELPKHVVCKMNDEKKMKVLYPVEKLEKDEKDLGAVAPCPPPNEVAMCIGGEPVSNIEARCAAGKL